MKNIRTQLSFDASEASNYEHPVGISQTVPDQGLSLRDLIDQQNKGLQPKLNESHYTDDFMPDLTRYDVTEIAEMHETITEQINQDTDYLKSKGLKVDRKKIKRR